MTFTANEIRKSLNDGEICAFYQPLYDTVTSKIKSSEALARWIKPDGSVISPFFFIPVAEESDLIMDIDWYIVELVCKTLVKQEGSSRHRISINFSRRHIYEENFTEKLSAIVDSYELSHKLIEIEITESAMVNDAQKILEWINAARRAGFRIAIDDFGSGLSSLQFVKDVPADVLKIDKSLLSQNCENEKERIVLESIFNFAHRLHMRTVAEGVETKEQLAFLRTCGCERIQGYIFAKPMPEADYVAICRLDKNAEEPADILQLQSPASAVNLLMGVIFRRYPLVIFSNLTRNSFYMMAYQNFTSTSCPSAGVFDELIMHGAETMYPDDKEAFATTFDRENLIRDYEKGKSEVRLVTRQLGDDGVYRRVETTVYYVKSDSSDDLLTITLCDNLPDK